MASPTKDALAHALYGWVVGGLLGLVDGCVNAGGADIPMTPFLLYIVAITSLPGTLVGGLLGMLFRIPWIRWIERLFKSRWVAAALLGGTIAAFCFASIWLRARGIQLNALDWTLPLMLLAGFAVFTGGVLIVSLPLKTARLLLFAAFALSAGIASFGTLRAHRFPGLIEAIEMGSRFAGPQLRWIRRGFDRDGDGFPSKVCETDCDCNDRDPTIHPAAIEVPGNGRDEDCRKGDGQLAKTSPPPVSTREYALDTPLNIILISVDAMRADHMHCYGYERVTTPNLDRLARENIRFTQVRSQGPSTRHAFPPLLTGRYFSKLALHKGDKWSKLLPQNATFAERLKEKNYTTRALLPYFRFKVHSGFHQGFDSWETAVDKERHPVWDPTGDRVTDAGILHLEALKKEKNPFFLWLHYFDPHASYVKHSNQPSFGNEKVDRYDGELLFVDREIGRFFDGVKKLGLWRDTVLIVIADHGEGLGLPGDHGQHYHGFTLFDTEIRVPMIIKLPGATPREVRESVALMDVAPTIMELGGVKPKAPLDGHSLVPYLFGRSPRRGPFLSELLGDSPKVALIDWPFKLIWHIRPNRYELYHLQDDPLEVHNRAEANRSDLHRLRDALAKERQR